MNSRTNKTESFNDQIDSLFGVIENGKTKTITFQVTDRCSLKCTYCYQINKSHRIMNFEVARDFIDLLFDTDNGKTTGIIIEFIGGEPFLEVELMFKIMEYWDYRCIMTGHRWGARTRISISSNGMHNQNERVKAFIEKYHSRLSLNITIDGNKELHDSARLTPDGTGSYDIAHTNAEEYKAKYGDDRMGSKITIAPSNIIFLYQAIKHYIEKDHATTINANVIFEQGWTDDDARLFYKELKRIANYLLDNDRDDVYISLFEEMGFSPMSEDDDQNWCGGSGAMLAVDPDGKIFPCIRYMKSSLGDEQPELDCGNIKDGIDYDYLENMYESITRRSQSTDECFYCPIAKLCAWCSAYNYQVFGTVNKRATFICGMHKARSLANVYYWNRLYDKKAVKQTFKMYLPKDDCLKIVDDQEYDLLKKLNDRPFDVVNV